MHGFFHVQTLLVASMLMLWAVHRLPGHLVAQVSIHPIFSFLKVKGMYTMPSVSSAFIFPHKGTSGAESRRPDQSKAGS